jgi:hypothetical protein
MAAFPNCPVCKDAVVMDLHMWNKYCTMVTARRAARLLSRQHGG